MTVLDTHVLVWLATGDPELGPQARQRADEALSADSLAVSAISFWELCMLTQKGPVELHQPVDAWRGELLALGLVEIPVSGEIGIAAAALPHFHQDPADRLITATAALEGALLLTADDRLLSWKGSVRRQDARR